MITATRLVEVEHAIASKIVEDALKHGMMITVNNGGEEDEIFLSNDKDAILENMFAADHDVLSFFIPENKKTRVGWVILVYGNEGYDVISDYVVNPVMEDLLKGAGKLADQLEAEDSKVKAG